MAVIRIVANMASKDADAAKLFYGDILGMRVAMDMGWIMTLAGDGLGVPQLSFASEGGSGTPVPDLSIEVDNFEEVLARMQSEGIAINYGPTVEPWGVTRFFVHDPFGRLVNILSHA